MSEGVESRDFKKGEKPRVNHVYEGERDLFIVRAAFEFMIPSFKIVDPETGEKEYTYRYDSARMVLDEMKTDVEDSIGMNMAGFLLYSLETKNKKLFDDVLECYCDWLKRDDHFIDYIDRISISNFNIPFKQPNGL